MSKIVHFSLYNPKDPNPLFKASKSDRAIAYTVNCSESGRCQLFAKGQCAARGLFGSCKYGRESREESPTPRAQGFYPWISAQNKKHEGVGHLKSATRKVAKIADSIWLPYSNVQDVLGINTSFIPVDEFTPELIVRICEAQPRYSDGRRIVGYQDKVVPEMVSHFSEEFPELFAQAAATSPRIREVLSSISKVGRKALVHTLIPNVGVLEKGWKWDGEYVYIDDEATMRAATIFAFVVGPEIRIRPAADAVVVVTDDGQVGPDTIFVN